MSEFLVSAGVFVSVTDPPPPRPARPRRSGDISSSLREFPFRDDVDRCRSWDVPSEPRPRRRRASAHLPEQHHALLPLPGEALYRAWDATPPPPPLPAARPRPVHDTQTFTDTEGVSQNQPWDVPLVFPAPKRKRAALGEIAHSLTAVLNDAMDVDLSCRFEQPVKPQRGSKAPPASTEPPAWEVPNFIDLVRWLGSLYAPSVRGVPTRPTPKVIPPDDSAQEYFAETVLQQSYTVTWHQPEQRPRRRRPPLPPPFQVLVLDTTQVNTFSVIPEWPVREHPRRPQTHRDWTPDSFWVGAGVITVAPPYYAVAATVYFAGAVAGEAAGE